MQGFCARLLTTLSLLFLFNPILFSQAPGVDPLRLPTTPSRPPRSITSGRCRYRNMTGASRAAGEVDRQDNDGPYRADWETLRKFEMPQWCKDAKFGIFIHWGVLAVSGAVNEWYPRNMYQESDPAFQEHRKLCGPQDRFGYKDLVPTFKAEKWDPADWARLFKTTGARYVIPVAEHHDGFAPYDSGLSDWTAVKMGPKRDVIGVLARAVRAEGVHFGTSFHRAEHDFLFDSGRKVRSDVNDPKYASLYGPAHAWLSDPNRS